MNEVAPFGPHCMLPSLALLLLLAPPHAAAQDEQPAWTDLTISPRAISEPLLEHRLFPDATQRRPGNATVILLRLCSNVGTPAWQTLVQNAPTQLKTPVEEFSPEQARKDVPFWYYDELRRAAFRESADWQYPLREGVALDQVVIQDIAEVRQMLRGLAVHARADIAEGKIGAALEKLTVGLALIDHIDTVTFPLVKHIEAQDMSMFLDRVHELIQHKDAPNLYWALTAVPDRLIDLRSTVDWELRTRTLHIPELRDLDRERSEQEWRELRLDLGLFRIPRVVAVGVPSRAEVEQAFQTFMQRARRDLPLLQPSLAQRVELMSDDEVTVRYFLARYPVVMDRHAAALLFPPPHGLELFRRSVAKLGDEEPAVERAVTALEQIYAAVWAQRRRLDALRVIEALRDYAARHDGQLPDSLADIEHAPVPIDPLTGEPFQYRREGDLAHLSAEPIKLFRKEEHVFNYRIHVR